LHGEKDVMDGIKKIKEEGRVSYKQKMNISLTPRWEIHPLPAGSFL